MLFDILLQQVPRRRARRDHTPKDRSPFWRGWVGRLTACARAGIAAFETRRLEILAVSAKVVAPTTRRSLMAELRVFLRCTIGGSLR